MAKTCIICGDPAGSREHIFPAALGGRRTNKSIYCGTHNEGFSPLAAVLSRQLELINALLSVRPDRSDAPRSIVLKGPDGNAFRLSGNEIKAHASTPTPEIREGEEQSLSFANDTEADAWIAEQRAKGYEVRTTNRQLQTRYYTEPIHAELVLGGPEGLRAIAYLALTYLAHNFPDVARLPDIDPLKAYALKKSNVPHVWWEKSAPVLGPNPFRFGHAIAIVVSACRAWARVELFSSLIFSVDLGPAVTTVDESIVTFIDPLAEHPPGDIQVSRTAGPLFALKRPADLTEHLRTMIASGAGEQQFTTLIRHIEGWNKQREFTPLVEEIRQASKLSQAERKQRIEALVDRLGQRIFNLMIYVTKEGAKATTAESAQIMARFADMTAPDADSGSGITKAGEAALAAAKKRIADTIVAESGSMDLDRLTLLLAGGPGAGLAGEAMLELAIDQMFPTAPSTSR